MRAFVKRREVGVAADLALEYEFVLPPPHWIIVVVHRRHRCLGGWRHAMTNLDQPPLTISRIVMMDGGGCGSGAAINITREDGNVPRGGECTLLLRGSTNVTMVLVGRVDPIIIARIVPTKMMMMAVAAC